MAPKKGSKDTGPAAAPPVDPTGAVLNATLTLWIRVRFQPQVGHAFFRFNWLDAAGEPNQPVETKPLSDPEEWKVLATTGSEDAPDDHSVLWERGFPHACTEEWSRAVRTAQLALELQGTDVEAEVRVALGPLLMAHAERRGETRPPFDASMTMLDTDHEMLVNREVSSSMASGALPGLLTWEAGVVVDGPLLSQVLQEKLRPLQVRLVSVKNLPMHETKRAPDPTVVPAFAVAYCDDDVDQDDRRRSGKEKEQERLEAALRTQTRDSGTPSESPAGSPAEPVDRSVVEAMGRLQTPGAPHGNEVRWDSPHVVFLGDVDIHVLRRWMQHGRFVVELHDRDPPNVGEGVVVPHGVARFSFAQLLKHNVRSVRMRGDVMPARGNIKVRFKKEKSGGIPVENLLTENTAEILQKFTSSDERREFTPDYVKAGTCLVVHVDQLVPLPSAKKVQQEAEEKQAVEWAQGEVKVDVEVPRPEDAQASRPVFEVVSNPDGTAFRARAGEERAPWRRTQEQAVADAVTLSTQEELPPDDEGEQFNLRYENYGRLILVLTYTETKLVRMVLQHVKDTNEKAFGLDPSTRELQTRTLSAEERSDPTLDMLNGFVILDGDIRIVVVEGLRQQGKALDRLVKSLPREKPNDHLIKFLYNKNIGFPTRAYVDFSQPLILKQVRLRQPLQLLGQQFKVYDPAKPQLIEGSAKAVLSLLKITDAERQHRLTLSDFPMPGWIDKLENQYGDFITDSELEGGTAQPEPRMSVDESGSEPGAIPRGSKVSVEDEDMAVHRKALVGSAMEFKARYSERRKAPVDQDNEAWEQEMLQRHESEPDFRRQNIVKVREQSDANFDLGEERRAKYTTDYSFLDAAGGQVFMYSGQTLNCTELQKAAMREEYLAQQETRMWTYSPVYNTNSFPLVEEGKKALVLREEYVQHPNVSAPSGSGPKSGKPLDDAFPTASMAASTLGTLRVGGARGSKRPWQYPNAPDGSETKPARDVGFARPDELHEQWQENEWHMWPGKERGLPLQEGVDGVTHSTRIPAEGLEDPWPRPFDRSKTYVGKTATGVHVPNDPFGARNMYTSPINDVTPVEEQEKMLQMTRAASQKELSGLIGKKDVSTWMKTRHCVTTTDKLEPILKPHVVVNDRKPEYSHGLKRIDTEPIKKPKTLSSPTRLANRPEDGLYRKTGPRPEDRRQKRHKFPKGPGGIETKRAHSVQVLPSSIHHHEPYHADCPNVTFQARQRANDADPPFNVQYGTFIPRSAEIGTRRGYMAGNGTAPRAPGLGPAPWRHTASGKKLAGTYVADDDFERYRLPPTMITRAQKDDNAMYQKMVGREEYLHKTASRTALNILDHTLKNNGQKFRPEFRTGRVELEI